MQTVNSLSSILNAVNELSNETFTSEVVDNRDLMIYVDDDTFEKLQYTYMMKPIVLYSRLKEFSMELNMKAINDDKENIEKLIPELKYRMYTSFTQYDEVEISMMFDKDFDLISKKYGIITN